MAGNGLRLAEDLRPGRSQTSHASLGFGVRMKLIATGENVPHPMHWDAFRAAAKALAVVVSPLG